MSRTTDREVAEAPVSGPVPILVQLSSPSQRSPRERVFAVNHTGISAALSANVPSAAVLLELRRDALVVGGWGPGGLYNLESHRFPGEKPRRNKGQPRPSSHNSLTYTLARPAHPQEGGGLRYPGFKPGHQGRTAPLDLEEGGVEHPHGETPLVDTFLARKRRATLGVQCSSHPRPRWLLSGEPGLGRRPAIPSGTHLRSSECGKDFRSRMRGKEFRETKAKSEN